MFILGSLDTLIQEGGKVDDPSLNKKIIENLKHLVQLFSKSLKYMQTTTNKKILTA